ncbi:hypothetical protein HK102_011968, partial [Quaeritorhiza haematococci]
SGLDSMGLGRGYGGGCSKRHPPQTKPHPRRSGRRNRPNHRHHPQSRRTPPPPRPYRLRWSNPPPRWYHHHIRVRYRRHKGRCCVPTCPG